MKRGKYDNIISIILLFIVSLIMLIYGVYANDLRFIVYSCFLLAIFLIIIVIYICIDLIPSKNIEKFVKKHKNSDKLYDKLYCKIYYNQTDYRKDLKSKKIGIENINFKNFKRYIWVRFSYVNFSVRLKIKESGIKYSIYSDLKYSKNGKDNKINTVYKYININDLSYDEFNDLLVNMVSEIKDYINEYRNNNQVDKQFNGKLFDKLHKMKSYFYYEGIAFLGFGLFFVIFSSFMVYLFVKDDITKKLELICGIGFIVLLFIFSLYLLQIGIFRLIKWIKVKKDINNKLTTRITGYPTKVKLCYGGKYKHKNYYDLICVKVYIDGKDVIIPCNEIIHFKTKENIKECILELEQIKCNFICLDSSYMAINGYDKIVNICKKILD